MDLPNITSKAQWYTSIATIANLAGYGLEFYGRDQINEETKALALRGLELFRVLAVGTGAAEQPQVSLSQLDALKTIEPLLPLDREQIQSLHLRLEKAVSTFETIVTDIDRKHRTVNQTQLETLQALLQEVAQTFVSKAFAECMPYEHDSPVHSA